MATGLLRTLSGSGGTISGGSVSTGDGGLGGPSGRVWAEDVYDVFSDISPWEHPVVSMLPHDDTQSIQTNWLAKKMNPLKATLDAKEEGYFFPYGPPGGANTLGHATWQGRAVLSNFIENFTFPIAVSSRAKAVDMLGGGGDEFGLRGAEAVKELGRNLEVRLFDDTFAVADGAGFRGDISTNPTLLKPLMQLIFQSRGATGLGFATTQASGVNAFRSVDMARVDKAAGSLTDETAEIDAATFPAWAQTRLTETMLTKAQELMRGNKDTGGVNPDTVVVPPATFGHVGAFGVGPGTGSGYGDLTVQMDASQEKISRVCRWFRSNFGLVQVIESRWLDQAKNTGVATTMAFGATPRDAARNCGLVWLFERKFLGVCWFQRPILQKIADLGQNQLGEVWAEATFKLLHPQAAGVIIGVNNV